MLSSFLSSTCVLLVSIVLLLKASPAHAVPMPTPDIYRNVENFARNKWADVNYNIRNPIREERREVTLCVPQKYALACTSVCGSQLDASPERQTQVSLITCFPPFRCTRTMTDMNCLGPSRSSAAFARDVAANRKDGASAPVTTQRIRTISVPEGRLEGFRCIGIRENKSCKMENDSCWRVVI